MPQQSKLIMLLHTRTFCSALFRRPIYTTAYDSYVMLILCFLMHKEIRTWVGWLCNMSGTWCMLFNSGV